MPKVSVVIPTHNRPQYLRRALSSLTMQVFKDFDVWVIQNGPYKESENIVKEFQTQGLSMNYRFVKQANPSNARNVGIQVSKGDYLAFLDDDDEWLPEKLKKQVSLLDQNPDLGFVTCRAWLVDPSNQIVGETPQKPHEDSLLELIKEGNFIRSLSFTMIRRICLEKVGLLDSRFPIAGDYELYLRLAARFTFQTIPTPLVRYQLHPLNLSQQGYFAYREVLGILKQFKLVPHLGVTKSVLSAQISKFTRLFYQEGCNAFDRKNFTDARRYFRWAIDGDPAVGIRIPWSRLTNPLYRFIRPYLALALASVKSLFAPSKRKSRIGYFLIGQAIGGNGGYVKKLINGLNLNEWEVILYLYCPQSKERSLYVEELEKKGVRIIPITVNGEITDKIPTAARSTTGPMGNPPEKRLFLPEGLKSLIYNFRLVSKIRRQLIKAQLDVVHFSMGIFPELLPAIVASGWAGIRRRVAFVHIIGIPPYRYKSAAAKFILKSAVRALTVVMTYGSAMKKILIEEYGFDVCKIHVVPNGVQLQEPKALSTNFRTENKIVLVPARLSEEKGHQFLFEAIARLEEKQIRATYWLAGDGPLKEELEKAVSHLKLDHSVKFLGFRTDMQELMTAADLIALPSLNEGFPFALPEAMTVGKPFIATQVGCVEDMVEQDVNGKMIPSGNVEALEQALAEMLTLEPAKLQEMGRRGREKATKEFTLEQMYQKTFQHYSLGETSLCAA